MPIQDFSRGKTGGHCFSFRGTHTQINIIAHNTIFVELQLLNESRYQFASEFTEISHFFRVQFATNIFRKSSLENFSLQK